MAKSALARFKNSGKNLGKNLYVRADEHNTVISSSQIAYDCTVRRYLWISFQKKIFQQQNPMGGVESEIHGNPWKSENYALYYY